MLGAFPIPLTLLSMHSQTTISLIRVGISKILSEGGPDNGGSTVFHCQEMCVVAMAGLAHIYFLDNMHDVSLARHRARLKFL